MTTGLLHKQKKVGNIGWMVDVKLSLASPPSISSTGVSGFRIEKNRRGLEMFKASEDKNFKKRKMDYDVKSSERMNSSNIGVELQMKAPLPLEWEQCLDLQSGRIYYVNRSTQLKTWDDPRGGEFSKDLRLDLELNPPNKNDSKSLETPNFFEKENMNERAEMVATVCGQCHMFVMFSKASRLCPSCKYLHPLLDQETVDDNNVGASRQTLSLIDCTGIQSKNKSKQKEDEK